MADPVSYRELVASHGGTDRPVLVLTDEELAAASPDVPRELEPLTLDALDGLADGERRAVLRSSLRSLAARGLVAEHPDEAEGLELRGELALVTGAQAQAATVTVASRTAGDVPQAMVLHALDDGAVLTDQVRHGIHVLHLVDHGDAVVALATFLDPHGWAEASNDGRVLEGGADDPPAGWEHVSRAAEGSASTLVSRAGAHLREVAVLPTPDGVWLVGGVAADAAGNATRIRAVQLGSTSLVSFLSMMLAGEEPELVPDEVRA